MHPWVEGIQCFVFFSNEGSRLFPGGDNYEIGKIHWRHVKIFSYRTAQLISTKLGTKHPWVEGDSNLFFYQKLTDKILKSSSWELLELGIQVCSNEEPHPFPRGDDFEIVKIHWQNKNTLLLKNHGASFNQFDTKHSCMKGIQVCTNEGPCPF